MNILDGVSFDTWHSLRDFSLILQSKEIEAPKVKTSTVTVEGMDGELDLTDFFGEPKYENRTITLTFHVYNVHFDDFDSLFSKIQNALHGKRMKIVFDSDASFYWMGRVSVDKWKTDKIVGTVTIDIDAEPYKYKKYATVISETISGEREFILTNLRKSVMPHFKANAEMQIVFGGSTYTIGAGDYTLENVLFTEGKNIVTVKGTGNISIEYQERGL